MHLGAHGVVWWRLGVLLGVPKVLLGVHLAVHRVRVQLGVARGLPPRQWCPTVVVTEVVVATTVEGVVGARSSGVGVWGEGPHGPRMMCWMRCWQKQLSWR